MRYTDDLLSNEAEAAQNGQRDVVDWPQLEAWIGNDAPHSDLVELVLDILNGIYPIADCVKEIKQYEE